MKIDIGCGNWRKDGYVGVDNCKKDCKLIQKEKLDEIIRWNLDMFPYPFFDDTITAVMASHVLEHLKEPKKVLDELYRICKHGILIEIYVPLHEMTSPDHITEFDENWFEENLKDDKRFMIHKKEVKRNKAYKTVDGKDVICDELHIFLKVMKNAK